MFTVSRHFTDQLALKYDAKSKFSLANRVKTCLWPGVTRGPLPRQPGGGRGSRRLAHCPGPVNWHLRQPPTYLFSYQASPKQLPGIRCNKEIVTAQNKTHAIKDDQKREQLARAQAHKPRAITSYASERM